MHVLKKKLNWVERADTEIENVGAVSNYRAEKRSGIKLQGEYFPYSFGTWLMAGICSGTSKILDEMDERDDVYSFDEITRIVGFKDFVAYFRYLSQLQNYFSNIFCRSGRSVRSSLSQ
jgi:hypothetical protein